MSINATKGGVQNVPSQVVQSPRAVAIKSLDEIVTEVQDNLNTQGTWENRLDKALEVYDSFDYATTEGDTSIQELEGFIEPNNYLRSKIHKQIASGDIGLALKLHKLETEGRNLAQIAEMPSNQDGLKSYVSSEVNETDFRIDTANAYLNNSGYSWNERLDIIDTMIKDIDYTDVSIEELTDLQNTLVDKTSTAYFQRNASLHVQEQLEQTLATIQNKLHEKDTYVAKEQVKEPVTQQVQNSYVEPEEVTTIVDATPKVPLKPAYEPVELNTREELYDFIETSPDFVAVDPVLEGNHPDFVDNFRSGAYHALIELDANAKKAKPGRLSSFATQIISKVKDSYDQFMRKRDAIAIGPDEKTVEGLMEMSGIAASQYKIGHVGPQFAAYVPRTK